MMLLVHPGDDACGKEEGGQGGERRRKEEERKAVGGKKRKEELTKFWPVYLHTITKYFFALLQMRKHVVEGAAKMYIKKNTRHAIGAALLSTF